MSQSQIDVYVEVGQSRAFATAAAWPGWCRSGRNEPAALQSLMDSAPRYAVVLQATDLAFSIPAEVSMLRVVGRLPGNTTTDFGAPDLDFPGDDLPVGPDELLRMRTVLIACWQAFDGAVAAAQGKSLRKGPRGGGRDVNKIQEHVLGGEGSYLSALGGKPPLGGGMSLEEDVKANRSAILLALEASARGEIAARGPRGGLRWTPRFFTRRLAWHTLDHAWEIEDRLE